MITVYDRETLLNEVALVVESVFIATKEHYNLTSEDTKEILKLAIDKASLNQAFASRKVGV